MLSDKEVFRIFKRQQTEHTKIHSVNTYPSQFKELNKIRNERKLSWVQLMEHLLTLLNKEK